MATSFEDPADRLAASPAWRAGRILDVRPESDFAAGHLRGAVSVPLPPDADPERDLPSILLPPRERPLLVVAAGRAEAAALAAALAARGRPGVEGLALTRAELAALPPEMVDHGPSRGHLWEPPHWLARHADLLPSPALGPVVDLGCGSGRAAVWLAARGYAVTACDREPEALARGDRLARTAGCRCDFRRMDLRHPGRWPAGAWSIVLSFRYLQRDLLRAMAGRVLPGGVALVRTFRAAAGDEGPPAARHRLGPGELRGFFPADRFEILAYAEDDDPDGHPAAGIVARRRAAT